MNELDREIERLEEGNAWEDTDEVVDVEFKKPLNVVVPVRLSGDTWRVLRHEAEQVGVGPSTLARMWLMERLNAGRKKRKAS
jgi:hypothetical protein